MNSDSELIDLLSRSTMFQNYQRSFNEATGLPLTLRAVDTWKLPLHGQRRENAWCALMAQKSSTCAACLQMQERLADSAGGEPATLTCLYGLSETVVPLKLGNKTTGYLQTGQVLPHPPNDACFNRAFKQANALGAGLDPQRARTAFFKSPVVPGRTMKSVTNLLVIFADHLSMKCNQIAMQKEHAESPMLVRAKQFIEDNLGEDLSLGVVARHVHVSIFYFCKMFRKYSGLTFTEYLSRRRVERAKSLLLNRNLRVSEIAYEAGFQSLTHFNRMFRKIAGESPTDYRSHLPAASIP